MEEPGGTPLKATSADAWVVEPTELLPLPSGNTVEVRSPDVLSMLTRGDLPNPLIGVVQRAYAESDLGEVATELAARAEEAGRTPAEQLAHERESGLLSEEDEAALAALVGAAPGEDEEAPPDALNFIDVIVQATVIEPELSFKRPTSRKTPHDEDGKISVYGLSDADKMVIFRWGTSQMDGLARFREDGSGPGSVSDSGEVRAEAEPTPGPADDAAVAVGEPLS